MNVQKQSKNKKNQVKTVIKVDSQTGHSTWSLADNLPIDKFFILLMSS